MRIPKFVLAFLWFAIGVFVAVDVMACTRVVYKGPAQTVLTGRTMAFSSWHAAKRSGRTSLSKMDFALWQRCRQFLGYRCAGWYE